MSNETITSCPFCDKMTIIILHIPFVSNTFTSNCRSGGTTTRIQKERFDVISGCEACGKDRKEVEDSLNGPVKERSHEDRLKRLKEAGLLTQIGG